MIPPPESSIKKEEEKDHGASLLPADPSASVNTETLPNTDRVRDGWRGLAAWMRAPGTIDSEDAIDACARAVENYAEYQFNLATPVPEHPAVTFLRQWENGDSARGTEQCPDCGRFPYEGHRVECRILALIFGLGPIGSGNQATDAERAQATRRSEAPESSVTDQAEGAEGR